MTALTFIEIIQANKNKIIGSQDGHDYLLINNLSFIGES